VVRHKNDANDERNANQLHEDKKQMQNGHISRETLHANEPTRARLAATIFDPVDGPKSSNRYQGAQLHPEQYLLRAKRLQKDPPPTCEELFALQQEIKLADHRH